MKKQEHERSRESIWKCLVGGWERGSDVINEQIDFSQQYANLLSCLLSCTILCITKHCFQINFSIIKY